MKGLIPEFEAMRARFPAGFASSLVLPCLRRIQEERGYVADADIEELAAFLGVPAIQIEEVLSFYTQFRRRPIGRWHLQRREFTGAINRFKVVVTRYQTTRHVEEALMRLTEAYMALGIVDEAQTSAAVLGHNFPDSRWYKDAYNLVRSGGVEPSENQGSWISRAFKKVGLG